MAEQLYGLNLIVENILKEIKLKNFDILDYKMDFFIEMEEPFEVLTIETNSDLKPEEMLKIEKEIANSFNLYEQNIILELY